MKKIIFKNPFVSKQDKANAKTYLSVAYTFLDQANKYYKNDDGTYTEYGAKLCIEAAINMNRAAKSLGFKNVADMNKYYEIHKSF